MHRRGLFHRGAQKQTAPELPDETEREGDGDIVASAITTAEVIAMVATTVSEANRIRALSP